MSNYLWLVLLLNLMIVDESGRRDHYTMNSRHPLDLNLAMIIGNVYALAKGTV